MTGSTRTLCHVGTRNPKPTMRKKSNATGRSGRKSEAAPAAPRQVQFSILDPKATLVCLAGTFHQWHPSATPKIATGEGRWTKTIELEPGMYEYLFVVDGRWVADPGSAITVSNPFGGIQCCVNIR